MTIRIIPAGTTQAMIMSVFVIVPVFLGVDEEGVGRVDVEGVGGVDEEGVGSVDVEGVDGVDV